MQKTNIQALCCGKDEGISSHKGKHQRNGSVALSHPCAPSKGKYGRRLHISFFMCESVNLDSIRSTLSALYCSYGLYEALNVDNYSS